MLLSQWLSRFPQSLTRPQTRRHRRRPQVQDVFRPSDPAKRVDVLEDRTLLSAFPVALEFGDFGFSSEAHSFTESGGTVFFVAEDLAHGFELWKTDGTPEGTVLVKDIFPGSTGSSPFYLTDVAGKLFFSAEDGVHGGELWMSDGTSAGTILVKDIRPGVISSAVQGIVEVGDTLYFEANDGVTGGELWKSDGTSLGTQLVRDINEGSVTSSIAFLTAFKGLVYFRASDGNSPSALWRTDGTNAGTTVIANNWRSDLTVPVTIAVEVNPSVEEP